MGKGIELFHSDDGSIAAISLTEPGRKVVVDLACTKDQPAGLCRWV